VNVVKPLVNWLFKPSKILKTLAVLNAAARIRAKSRKAISSLRDIIPKINIPKDSE